MVFSLIGLKCLQEFLHAHAGLTQYALQRFGKNGFVVRHGEAHRAFVHPNVRAFLPHHLKTQTPQCADRFVAGNIARQFHTVASTGSSTK